MNEEESRAEAVASRMAESWRRGERLPVEHWLDLHPELLASPEAAILLVYEEVCLRREAGHPTAASELRRRFPQWEAELAALLDCDRLAQGGVSPSFPIAGENVGEFHLVAELGAGTRGRVYLATQQGLGDRPMVVKATPLPDREAPLLARLQHTHIIPLYGVSDLPALGLRLLCMPYHGGNTLARLLEALRPIPFVRRTGAALMDTLATIGTPLPPAIRGGPGEALAGMPYADAVCWIGACLADALQHAHERGLLHLDVKPANVLIAADGQPMLLDFHLAIPPLTASLRMPEGIGGTPEYMSPEHRAAFDAARLGLPSPVPVDGRSDVYSLGRVLHDALGTGCASPGLSDVVARCLADDPPDRYPDAASLADDLRRHLANRPLRGVPNRSLAERWRKWRHRQPHAPLWAGLALALTAVVAVLGATMMERHRDAEEALRTGLEQLKRKDYPQAVLALERGKERAGGLLGSSALLGQLEVVLAQAKRAEAARRLNTFCDRLRLLDSDQVSNRERQALDDACRTAWAARELVGEEEQARADLIDLALAWADLRKGKTCPSSAELLAEAEQLRKRDEAAPRTFRDHAHRGRAALRAGDLEAAAAHLEQAREQRPQDFWAAFHSGLCAHRRHRHADAVASFTVAIALAPDRPEAYHNRALAHAAAGQRAAARRDYNRALTLDPALAPAALNRGVLNYREGRYREALDDLERAMRHGIEPALAQHNLALVRQALGESP